MTYARLCEHKQLRSHEIHCGSSNCLIPQDHEWCKGGEFLPEGALVIEKVDGEWPEWFIDMFLLGLDRAGVLVMLKLALASQVGESE